MKNIYSNLKFRVWKYDIPCASEKIIMAEVGGHTSKCYKGFSWCKLSLIHGQDFNESYRYSLRWKFSLIQDNQRSQHPRKYKRQKLRNNVGPKMEKDDATIKTPKSHTGEVLFFSIICNTLSLFYNIIAAS